MAHRKIDVDALDADQYLDDEELAFQASRGTGAGDEDDGSSAPTKANITNIVIQPPLPVDQMEQLVQGRATAVRGELSRGNVQAAVVTALDNPPIGLDPQSSKDKNTQTVMEALMACKAADIANIVKALNVDQLDVLMKYLYRGMASPEKFNAGVLLQWHERTLEAGGLGSIVRVLTDRKTV